MDRTYIIKITIPFYYPRYALDYASESNHTQIAHDFFSVCLAVQNSYALHFFFDSTVEIRIILTR